MEQIEFPQDFSGFLKLLNAHHVEYLLIGGFAVAIHGYPRATAVMDVWVARNRANAERIVSCLRLTDRHKDLASPNSGANDRVTNNLTLHELL